MHIAISIETRDKLLPSLNLLNKEIKKVSQFRNIIKVGRTHLQDATSFNFRTGIFWVSVSSTRYNY